jgi:hypothetical protein
MINHISIGVYDTEKVAKVLAEIWNGYALPFPPSPNSYIVFADDNKGTAVEVTPISVELIPGENLPAEENYDLNFPTQEYEATFQIGENSPKFVPVHLAINSPLSEEDVKAIARREGWRTLTANRGGGIFQLIEVWVENRFMFEVFTPEMTARYVEIMKPENWANFLQVPLPPKPAVATNLNLVG